VKVWNRKKNLVFTLDGHLQEITGLILNPFSAALSNSNILPLLLSSSVDGCVRQWNLDLGACNYILETGAECLGIKWIKGENFVTHSKRRICIWNLNHYYWTFSVIKAPIIYMRRYKKGNSARILTVTEDYTIRLICPISGTVLSLSCPPITTKSLKTIVYNPYADQVFALMNEGSILVINTKTNPGTVVSERTSETKDKLCVIEGATIPETELDQKFILLGGTDAGQIVIVDNSATVKYSFVIQAHSASILDLKYSDNSLNLFSISSGKIFSPK
jgi:WD40 repeat protein